MNHARLTPLLTLLILLATALLTACQGRATPVIPTRIPSIEQLATSDFLTANAPPEGFREQVIFPAIDANLPSLPNWRYEATLSFNGIFAGTPRPAAGTIRVQVWHNQLGTQRRVVIETSGELFGIETEGTVITREAVRLGPDTFLVENNACTRATEGEPAIAADLLISQVIGGVNRAIPVGVQQVINGEQVWRYDFVQDDLLMPYIRLGGAGRILSLSRELWVAPARNAVIRFWLTMNVENVVIFEQLIEGNPPVSGELVLRYDLYSIGTDPNITQPFGC
ncbi:MAG: hypothetical protein SF029_13260 [bacterium]|nr:hypothetical protein [bacterium]